MKRTLRESDKKIVACNQKWHCAACKELLPSTYQIDHVIPFSISADDTITNLEALCPNCHSQKTQRENFRINRFKKLCAFKETPLCWFCLDEIDIGHKCSRKFKKISLPKPKYENKPKDLNKLDKFIYTEPEEDDVLRVRLENDFIWVDKFFTEVENREDYVPARIARAIFIATRSKKFSKKFK